MVTFICFDKYKDVLYEDLKVYGTKLDIWVGPFQTSHSQVVKFLWDLRKLRKFLKYSSTKIGNRYIVSGNELLFQAFRIAVERGYIDGQIVYFDRKGRKTTIPIYEVYLEEYPKCFDVKDTLYRELLKWKLKKLNLG